MKPNVLIFSLLAVFIWAFAPAFSHAQIAALAPHNDPHSNDTHAQFPGGMEAFSKYLSTQLVYPMKARENDVEGNVFARFSVSKDGEISHITILRGLGHGCNEEVKRVLELMPAWQPARKNGQAIDSFVIIPVQFRLTDF